MAHSGLGLLSVSCAFL